MGEQAELHEQLVAAKVDPALAERLAEFGARLLDAGRQTNLTGAKSAAELVDHLLDSLSVVPFVTDPLVDVGSGGGLPAIPLAIATGVPVTMVESTGKKARFLEVTIGALGLRGTVVAERAEVAAHDPALRERFASATARAVAVAPAVAELTLPFLAPGGLAVLQRGELEEHERDAVSDAAMMLGGMVEREEPLGLDRRLLLIRKTGTTQLRFPRRAGIPQKRPLCL